MKKSSITELSFNKVSELSNNEINIVSGGGWAYYVCVAACSLFGGNANRTCMEVCEALS